MLQLVTVTPEGINIPFSKWWGKDLSSYESFPMGRKRNFKSNAARIVDCMNELIEKSEAFRFSLLSTKYEILKVDSTVTDETLPALIAAIFTNEVVDLIKAESEKIYSDNDVNIDSKDTKKNEELQFTNEHALIILEWSVGTIIASPFITTYMNKKEYNSADVPDLIMEVFCEILKKFEPPTIDILAKLHKIAESRVLQTQYSDKVIWNYLKNIAVDSTTLIIKLKRKFITEGIPKLDQGVNIIGFLHTFLKNQISFQFTAKFLVSFKPLTAISSVADRNTAIEHLETELIRSDEGVAAINEAAIIRAVQLFSSEIKYFPPRALIDEYVTYFQKYNLNNWQKSIVNIFYLSKVGSIKVIKIRNMREYTIMFLLMLRWLKQNNFKIIHDYLNSFIVVQDLKRIQSKRRFITDLIQSKRYIQLIENNFSHSAATLSDSEYILTVISSLYTGTFNSYPDSNGEIISVQYEIEDAAQEILGFIENVISRN